MNQKCADFIFPHSDPDLENLDTEAIQSQPELSPKMCEHGFKAKPVLALKWL